jgi:hypothetical protein
MIKSKCPTLSSNVEEMRSELTTLSDELDQITGKKHYHNIWKKRDEEVQGFVYSDDAFLLRAAILKFIIDSQKSSSANTATLNAEKQQVLLQTYKTIIDPSYENCKKLQRLADSVDGHPQHWKKVYTTMYDILLFCLAIMIVLLAIATFSISMLFIRPWDVFSMEKAKNRWTRTNRHGLSESTDSMVQAIYKTGAPSRLYNSKFFNDERHVNPLNHEPVMAEVISTNESNYLEASAPMKRA